MDMGCHVLVLDWVWVVSCASTTLDNLPDTNLVYISDIGRFVNMHRSCLAKLIISGLKSPDTGVGLASEHWKVMIVTLNIILLTTYIIDSSVSQEHQLHSREYEVTVIVMPHVQRQRRHVHGQSY